jgi:hypothetical protein
LCKVKLFVVALTASHRLQGWLSSKLIFEEPFFDELFCDEFLFDEFLFDEFLFDELLSVEILSVEVLSDEEVLFGDVFSGERSSVFAFDGIVEGVVALVLPEMFYF